MPDSNLPNRRSIRLPHHDYASTAHYFITIVTQNRIIHFGNIENETIQLNAAGQMIETEWRSLATRFPTIELDEYIIMPNHFHALIFLHNTQSSSSPQRADTAELVPPPAPTLGDIVSAFKSITTNNYIQGVKNQNWPPFEKRLWQRNYFEHIIRDDEDLYNTRTYIQNNPLLWHEDPENLNHT